MQISDSIALVTGSARRIGRAIAVELARRGARLAIHYRSSEADAAETLRMVRELGADGEMFQADLANDSSRDRLIEAIRSRFATAHILVNNASEFSPGTLEASTPEMWDKQMDANARAPFFLARSFAAMMRESGRGKILNIADPAGEKIWTGYLSYSVSKAALLGVTQGLAKALAPGVQVNAIAPGPVHFPDSYTPEQKQLAIERTLLKRSGSPEDVVRAVVFLIENDYITGEVLHVDGGRHVL
jgi:NAD(P)-dependent dehydrogenase (short-subunit alcohol dehydrogenase family)